MFPNRFSGRLRLGLIAGLSLMTWRASAQAMPGMAMMRQMSEPPCQSSLFLGCADTATPVFAPDGTLLLAWTQDHGVYFARSRDLGKTWMPPLRIADVGTAFDGGADARPQMVADAAGHVLIAYDTFKDRSWDAEIWLARSSDGGAHFEAPTVFEFGAVSQRLPALDLLPSGKILMVWQDKRLSKLQRRPGASIAYAWSADGGKTFSASAIAAPVSCPCCHIGLTTTVGGLPMLAFRTIFPGEVRDHVILGFMPSGLPGKPRRVAVDDWVTDACPHQGPSVAVSGDGTVHVVWYTEGKARQGLFYARLIEGGQHFSAPQRLGNPDRMPSRPFVFARGNEVWRVWKEFDGHASHVLMQQSRDDGRHWSTPSVIASAGGRSDHPLLISDRSHVFLSWLSREHGYRLIPLPERP